jgi:hypothetical protein
MKRSTILRALFLALVLAASCAAADITGTWKGVFQMGDNNMEMTFTFKQEGTRLSGTVTPPNSEPISFSGGKVEGDKLSFVVTAGEGMKVYHDGAIVSATEIKLNTKFEGMDQAGPPMTLKKQ